MISVVCAVRDLSEENVVIKNLGKNKPGQVVFVEGKSPSLQRNAGVKQALGSIIYFIDDDSVIPPGILERAEIFFEAHPEAAVLGGPELTPDTDSILQKSFGAVFSSPFAAGRSSFRYARGGALRESSEKELILCNMFIRKEVFEELKGFDERLYPNEENEFLSRVKDAGMKIYHDPDIFIYRSKRKDYQGFIKQCFNYGRGRTEQSFVNFTLSGLVNFIPAFFLVYLISEIMTLGMDLVPLAFYVMADIFFSVKAGLSLKNSRIAMLSMFNFFVLHVIYGAGTLFGFITAFTIKERVIDTDIRVKVTVP